MKKILSLIVCFMLVFSITSCKQINEDKENEKKINEAIEVLTESWEDAYKNLKINYKDKYVKIINTRIVYLKDSAGKIDPMFKDIEYIVEFEILSNYLNTSPYYENISRYDNVVVKKNGKTEVSANLLRQYRSKTYENNYPDIIESIKDYEEKFNRVLDIE